MDDAPAPRRDIVVMDLTGTNVQPAEVPANVASGRIAARLVELMELPTRDHGGHEYGYDLVPKRTGRAISRDETLQEAGVEDGDVMRLIPDNMGSG